MLHKAPNTYQKPAVVSTIAHEIKNPLTVVLLYSRMLSRTAKDKDPEQLHKLVEPIERNAALIEEMITSMTDAMKVEAGTLVFRDKPLQFCETVIKILDEFRQEWPEFEFQLATSTAAKKARPIHLDPQRLRQLLRSILRNAVVYSEESSKVAVTVSSSTTTHTVTIRDWGVGIPADRVAVVTDAYYRGDESHPLQRPGLGLGLFLAQSITDHYQGMLAITPLQDGTEVTVNIPR